MPDVFLYSGEPNPNDVRLSDPTMLRGGGANPQTITAIAYAEVVTFGSSTLKLTVAGTGYAEVVGLGTGKLNQNITATGKAQVIGLGSSNVKLSISATGKAQSIGLGTSILNLSIQPSGYAEIIGSGTATLQTPQTIIGSSHSSIIAFGNFEFSLPTEGTRVIGFYYGEEKEKRKKLEAQKIVADDLAQSVQFGDSEFVHGPQTITASAGIAITPWVSDRIRLNQNIGAVSLVSVQKYRTRNSIHHANRLSIRGRGIPVRSNSGMADAQSANPHFEEELSVLISLIE